jgi:hypothetical protein
MVPVNVMELWGQRYLVAPRGIPSGFAICAPPAEAELRRRGRIEPFRAAPRSRE